MTDLDAIVAQHEHALRLGKFGPKDLRKALREKALRAAEELLDGILSENCEHDTSPAYMKRYECFPAGWNDHGQGDGCLLTALKAAMVALVEQSTREEQSKHSPESCTAETCVCFAAGLTACLMHRCVEHRAVPQQNSSNGPPICAPFERPGDPVWSRTGELRDASSRNERSGAECGGCIAAERDAALADLAALRRTDAELDRDRLQKHEALSEERSLREKAERERDEALAWRDASATYRVAGEALRERALADRLAEALTDVVHSCAGVGESSFGYFTGYKIVVTRDQLERLRALLAEHAKARA